MPILRRLLYTTITALTALIITNGCGASHSSLPTLATGGGSRQTDSKLRFATNSATNADSVAINAGGGAAGGFAADEDYGTLNSWEHRVSTAIDTTLIPSPAPQAVYQSQRTGPKLLYTIPGLTPGARYTVTLSFAELALTGPGQRLFNVSLNGTQVLSSFDVFATAGAADKAVAETFNVAAGSSGTIAVAIDRVITSSAHANSTINAIEIAPLSASSPSPSPSATPTLSPTPTPSPSPSTTPAFVDWPSYGYDVGRTGYNPNTTNLTPASVAQLHIAWQLALGKDSRTQPLVVTGIPGHAALLIIGDDNLAEAYDALSGTLVWKTTLPLQDLGPACGTGALGISGTAAYDSSLGALFMAAGNGNPRPNHVILYRLAVATGNITGQVDVTPTSVNGESNHGTSGITFADGQIYLGTSSDCESGANFPMWRGRVASVDPGSMTLLNTFFATWGHGGNYGGGGVWGWGGVSSDSAGNIYTATGNTETSSIVGTTPVPPPFVLAPTSYTAYGEQLVKLDASLNVENANYPGFDVTGHGDLDYAGTPVVFQPPGCGLLVATQGKGGTLVVNNASDTSEVSSFAFSVRTARALYIGNPGYSPVTGYLYAAIASAQTGTSLLPPGLAAITGCGTSIAWHAQFGPDSELLRGSTPRSAPTVTAGGVVFMATPCVPDGNGGCAASGSTVGGALWAVDATTGSVLNGAKPLLITASQLRMAPSADGDWLFLIDDGGNFYGLTIDSAFAVKKPKTGLHVTPRYVYRGD